jgi:hypothetical protein
MAVSVTNILLIIQLTLSALQSVPVIGADAALAGVFVKILQAALAEYQTQTGKPFDATTIPQQTPVS